MAKRALAAGISLVLIFTVFAALLSAGGFVFAPKNDFGFIKDNQSDMLSHQQRYIVKFSETASLAQISELLTDTDYCIIGESHERLFAVSEVKEEFFKNNSAVIEYYECDAQRNVYAAVNDTEPTPYYDTMGVNLAWDKTVGSSDVIVAILDTGINRNHQDLINADILDGYDAVTRKEGVFSDEAGHGTAVAGIIAAEANNDFGIAGVAYGVTIMPVKVSYSGTAIYSSDLVRGIRYAADNGAKIINMSLGGYSASIAEQEAVNYALSKGCILISAAGNGGNGEHADAKSYPASYEGVVSVASCDSFGERSLFSQYNDKVDIAATGENIVIPAIDENGNSVYRTDSGTSYACAIVSGIAALAVSHAGDVRFDSAEFDALIAELGDYTRDDNLGYGIIYADKAIEIAQTPIITGVENGRKYSQSVKIGFNRGSATLNGEPITDGETRVADGVHTLIVTHGDTVKTVKFTLDYTPLSYEFLEFASYAQFNFDKGSATLNGFPYKSGEKITVSGRHEFVLAEGEETVKKTVELKYTLPTVFGIEDGKTYTAPVEILVIGEGTATLDGNEFFGEKVVADSGNHILKIKNGNGSQEAVYSFTVDYQGYFVNNDYANGKAAIDEENGYFCLYGDSLVGVRIYDMESPREYAMFLPVGRVYSHTFRGNELMLFGDYGVTILDRTKVFDGESAIIRTVDASIAGYYIYIHDFDTLYGFGNNRMCTVNTETGEYELVELMTDTPIQCEIAHYRDGLIYMFAPSVHSKVMVYDIVSETFVTEYDIGGSFTAESLCFGEKYFSVGNRLYDISDGSLVMEFAATKAVKIDNNFIYANNRIIDIANAKEIGSFPFEVASIYNTPQGVYLFGATNKYGKIPVGYQGIIAYGAAERIAKTFSAPETATVYRNNAYFNKYYKPLSVAVSHSALYMTVTDSNGIFGLDTASMTELEPIYLKYKPSKLVCENGYLTVLFSNISEIYVAPEDDVHNGKYIALTAVCVDAAIANDSVYAIAVNGSVVKIDIANGTHRYFGITGQTIATDGSNIYLRDQNRIYLYDSELVKQETEFATFSNTELYIGNGIGTFRTIYDTSGQVIAKLDRKILAFRGNTVITEHGIFDLVSKEYIGNTGIYAPKFVAICKNNTVIGMDDGFISVNSCSEGDEVVTDPKITGVEPFGAYNNKTLIRFEHGVGYLDGKPFNSGDTVSYYGSHIFSLSLPCGRNIQIPFSITPPLDEIQFLHGERTMSVGESIALQVIYLPEGANSIPVVFSTNGKGIEVNEAGVVTATAVGKYTVFVTAETQNGTLTAVTVITVRDDLITPTQESGIYIDRNNFIIKGIKPGTAVKDLGNLFYNSEKLKVLRNNKEVNGFIATGDIIQLVSDDGTTADRLYAVTDGDTDGDGFITACDIYNAEQILKGYNQNKNFGYAADINHDGRVDDKDLKLLKNLLLSKTEFTVPVPPQSIVGECTIQTISTTVTGDVVDAVICINGAKGATGVNGKISFSDGLEYIGFKSEWVADCNANQNEISFYAYNTQKSGDNHCKFIINLQFRITAGHGDQISISGDNVTVVFADRCESFKFINYSSTVYSRIYGGLEIRFQNAKEFVFNPKIKTYTVSIPYNSALADIYLVYENNESAEASSRYVSMSDEEIITVAYTDANGNTTNYTITVIREAPPKTDNNCKLEDLEIEGHKLSPRFDPNFMEYSITVPYGTEKIGVYALPQNSTAKVVVSDTVINGKDGVVTVTVAAPDGTMLTYILKVRVLPPEPVPTPDEPAATQDQGNSASAWPGIIITLAVLAIAALVVVYIKNKQPED